MLAGMRDLIPHELLEDMHQDTAYKRQSPINLADWAKPGEGVYHKRDNPFTAIFYDYMNQ